MKKKFEKELSVVLSGEAGQGIKSLEKILVKVLKQGGFNVFSTKEYMSRIRGGVNSTEIRISSENICSFVNTIDILIPLKNETTPHLQERISSDTLVIGDK